MIKRLKSFLIKVVLVLLLAPIVMVGAVKFIDPPIWGWKLSRLVSPPTNYPDHSQHEWVPLSQISKNMQLAVIATEDQKFPTHYGVDFESLFNVIANADEMAHPAEQARLPNKPPRMCFCFLPTLMCVRPMSFTLHC